MGGAGGGFDGAGNSAELLGEIFLLLEDVDADPADDGADAAGLGLEGHLGEDPDDLFAA